MPFGHALVYQSLNMAPKPRGNAWISLQ